MFENKIFLNFLFALYAVLETEDLVCYYEKNDFPEVRYGKIEGNHCRMEQGAG